MLLLHQLSLAWYNVTFVASELRGPSHFRLCVTCVHMYIWQLPLSVCVELHFSKLNCFDVKLRFPNTVCTNTVSCKCCLSHWQIVSAFIPIPFLRSLFFIHVIFSGFRFNAESPRHTGRFSFESNFLKWLYGVNFLIWQIHTQKIWQMFLLLT